MNGLKIFFLVKGTFGFVKFKKYCWTWDFKCGNKKRGGSHFVFKHPKLEVFVVLVSHGKNDVLPEYQLKKAIRAMERLGNIQE